jgi:ABC-2 type transport system ATP-binding protein
VNLLEANHLAKSYGDTEAVRDVSFILPAGYIMGLVGPNGAGNTACRV